MSLNTLRPSPLPFSVPVSKGNNVGSLWFALALPAFMAVLLAAVMAVGTSAKLLVLGVLIPLAVWAAFMDTEKAIYVYLAWCWLDGTIRGLFDSNAVAIVARDLVMFLILIGWGLRRLATRRQDPLRAPPGTLLVVLFIINVLLQAANPNSIGLMADLAGFKIHLAFLPLLFIGYDVFRRREQVRSLLIFLTLATLVISLVSVVQYLQGPDWTYTHFPGAKEIISQNIGILGHDQYSHTSGFKPPGTTTFGGGTGGFIGLIMPLSFGLLLLSRRLRLSHMARLSMGGIIFGFIIAVFLNSVRSGLVDAVVGMALCGFLVGGKTAARAALIGMICLVMGLAGWNYSQTLSNGHSLKRFATTFADPVQALHSDRQTFFDQFNYLITHAPLGIGLGRVGAASVYVGGNVGGFSNAIFSEAYLGNMIAETGIFGGLLIFSIALLFLVRGFENLKHTCDEDDRILVASMLAVLGVIFANFFASPVLLSLPGAPLFWLFGAILMRVFNQTPTLRESTARQVEGTKQ